MNEAVLLREIVSNYQKFGWTLRRVILTETAARAAVTQILGSIASGVLIETSDVNALWFSRAASGNGETWELRLLAASPFALLEIFAAETSAPERVRRQQIMLDKMRTNAKKFIV